MSGQHKEPREGLIDFAGHQIVPSGASVVVEANGLRHHALRYGDPSLPVLLILPGITSPAITWEFVAVPLSTTYSVLVLDMRGRGYSETPETGYTMDDYAADIAGIIDALALQQPMILGHSMGARNAAAFAAANPGKYGPLIVVDPPLTGPGRAPYPFPREIYTQGVRDAVAGMSADDVRKGYPTWPERELAIRAEWLATCDENAVAESYDLFDEEDFFAPWSACAAPLLFIYGENSPVVDTQGVEDVHAANPVAEIERISGAGHMIPWDNLPDFLQVVTEFLERNVKH